MSTSQSCSNQSRKNYEWITALQGNVGLDEQRDAYNELSQHLYTIICFYLRQRQPELLWLSTLSDQEIISLTQDLVQSCLLKLSKDNHARLHQYSGAGTFKGWTAQIAINAARSELRKVRWDRRMPLENISFLPLDKALSPAEAAQQAQLRSTL